MDHATRPLAKTPHQLTADHTRSVATQPYRTTRTAQTIARQLTVDDAGTRQTLRPLADILSPRTRATLAALRKAGTR